MSIEISSTMKFFFQNCVSIWFYNNNYRLFAQGAKLGNFGCKCYGVIFITDTLNNDCQ